MQNWLILTSFSKTLKFIYNYINYIKVFSTFIIIIIIKISVRAKGASKLIKYTPYSTMIPIRV